MAKRRRTHLPGGVEYRPMPRRTRPVTLLLGAFALLAVGVVVGAVVSSFDESSSPTPGPAVFLGPTSTPGPPASLIPAPGVPTADPSGVYPPISVVGCDTLEQTAYHIHAHLTLRFGGELHAVPANIGIRGTCFYWLHTHRNAGVIHVEAPGEQVITLGQFFDVWGEVLADRQVLDRPLQPNEGLYVFVDGQRYQGDPRAIVLTDLLSIEIQVGTAPFQPLPYEFSPDFL
jgi:hypothetical protein